MYIYITTEEKAVSALMRFMNPCDNYNTNPLASPISPLETISLLPHPSNATPTSFPSIHDSQGKTSTQRRNSDPGWYGSDRQQEGQTSPELIGTLFVEIELLERREIEKEFYEQYVLTYFAQEQLQSSTKISLQNSSFSGSKVYEMLLCLGIHPSDQEFESQLFDRPSVRGRMTQFNKIMPSNDDFDEKTETQPQPRQTKVKGSQPEKTEEVANWDEVWMDSKTVVRMLVEHSFETSVSLTYYLYEHLKTKYQRSNRNSIILTGQESTIHSRKRKDSILQCDLLEAGWWVRFFKLPLSVCP
ncbi:hypothetical protein RFI_24772 [Reticulomyxa filosa]|uniref:Uncharacterized protein n=1 Tax=Reticulomyxa filosa TaxID=46433 RepID=X6MF02_RETFI|nr:hypothetical protein RFI_24772 [Reticulomyxa filosa]|eukprot:ETO12603.1 hypothetical protein RFI_24772 [Reticulomyxa filosa]